MKKTEIQKMANAFLDKEKKEECWATADGNIFDNENLALFHAKTNKVEIFHLVKEVKEVKEVGNTEK